MMVSHLYSLRMSNPCTENWLKSPKWSIRHVGNQAWVKRWFVLRIPDQVSYQRSRPFNTLADTDQAIPSDCKQCSDVPDDLLTLQDRQEPVYRDVSWSILLIILAYSQMYDEAMDGIKKHLVGRTKKSNLMFTQELHPAKHPETGEQYVPSSNQRWQAGHGKWFQSKTT